MHLQRVRHAILKWLLWCNQYLMVIHIKMICCSFCVCVPNVMITDRTWCICYCVSQLIRACFFNWMIFARCNVFSFHLLSSKKSFNPKLSFVKYISCYNTTSTKCLTWFDLKYTQLTFLRDPCHLKMHSRKLSMHVTKCQNIANNDVNSWEHMRSASVLRDRTTNLQIKITRIK